MKASLGSNGTAPGHRLAFWCPGCDAAHSIVVSAGGWRWNGDLAAPSVWPSIFVHSHPTLDDAGQRTATPDCHSFVEQGFIKYLDDCTHALAGSTVPLPEWAL